MLLNSYWLDKPGLNDLSDMENEAPISVEVMPTSEQAATAAPETEVLSPETPAPAPKTFTQEEMDAVIGKRLARERRTWEREHAVRETPQPEHHDNPTIDQFPTPEAYAEALATKKAVELVAQQAQAAQGKAALDVYHAKVEDAREKYEDYDQVVQNDKLAISPTMAQAIMLSDNGAEVAYHLGTNPKEAARIHALSPIVQVKEIGKIEAKLAADPPVKRTTTAPEPIKPVSARSNGNPSYDTTDPRSTQAMSVSEWIAAERARQMRKMQASTH